MTIAGSGSLPWGDLIDLAHVHALHTEGLARYGKSGEAREPTAGCVEGALGNAWSAEAYQSERRHVKPGLAFASYLLFYLAKDHCFFDGNKRVAWSAMVLVLHRLGLTIEADTDAAEAFVDGVVTGAVRSGAEVAAWLSPRLRASAT